ncbi:hypothetical protein V3C99_002663, partial [Haemonchus contortus]
EERLKWRVGKTCEAGWAAF